MGGSKKGKRDGDGKKEKGKKGNKRGWAMGDVDSQVGWTVDARRNGENLCCITDTLGTVWDLHIRSSSDAGQARVCARDRKRGIGKESLLSKWKWEGGRGVDLIS